MATVLTEALEEFGYRAWLAADGAEARNCMERVRPDLVLLDLMLPDVDGLMLLPALKAAHDVPVVICSARDEPRERVLALRLGADGFVGKPYDMYELEARMEAVLRRTLPIPIAAGTRGGLDPPMRRRQSNRRTDA
jgi:two-component system, OmpR family, response regulator